MAKQPRAKPSGADRALASRKLLAAARGARLCYGEPVHVEGRTVIPVARVRAAGGAALTALAAAAVLRRPRRGLGRPPRRRSLPR